MRSFVLHQVGRNRRRAVTRWALVFIAARVLPHRFLVFTLHLDHDVQPPTTKEPGQGRPRIGFGHHRSERREGGDKHDTSKPRLWIRGRPPHHDSGEFLSLSR